MSQYYIDKYDEYIKERNKKIKKDLTTILCKKLSANNNIEFTDYQDNSFLVSELEDYLADETITLAELLETLYQNFEYFTSEFNKGINTDLLDFEANVYDGDPKYQILIEDLDVSLSTKTLLKHRGFKFVFDILNLTFKDILSTRGLGKSSLIQLSQELDKLDVDYRWKEDLYKKYFDINICESETDNPKHEVMVAEIEFSPRIKNALARNEIVYVKDLIDISYKRLDKIRGLGIGSLHEISKKLDEMEVEHKWKTQLYAVLDKTSLKNTN